jgi:hypothetical protein
MGSSRRLVTIVLSCDSEAGAGEDDEPSRVLVDAGEPRPDVDDVVDDELLQAARRTTLHPTAQTARRLLVLRAPTPLTTAAWSAASFGSDR